MGGERSGRYYRWDAKPTTSDYIWLDIRRLKKMSGWRVGNQMHIFWGSGEDQQAVSVMVEDEEIWLRYNNRNCEGEAVAHRYPVHLSKTPCHLGGHRIWFTCPDCSRRVAILYGASRFVCRNCLNLAYESQRGRNLMKARNKINAIHEKLGWDLDAYWGHKPKRMHWRTYDKLKCELLYWHEQNDKIISSIL